jgi:hypothetical protein
MSHLSIFLQFEGSRAIELVELPSTATPEDIIEAAIKLGLPEPYRVEALVFSEHGNEPLEREKALGNQGGEPKGRFIVHRCRKVEVTLHFNAETKHHAFVPAATVEHVKRWFVDTIGMTPVDASEHVLQITGTKDRPDLDVHIGTLVSHPCVLDLTLVPRKRIEG